LECSESHCTFRVPGEGIEPSWDKQHGKEKNARAIIGRRPLGTEERGAVAAGSAGSQMRRGHGRSKQILERQTNEEVSSIVAGGPPHGVQITDLEPGHYDRELESAPDSHPDAAVTMRHPRDLRHIQQEARFYGKGHPSKGWVSVDGLFQQPAIPALRGGRRDPAARCTWPVRLPVREATAREDGPSRAPRRCRRDPGGRELR
jgi:hypothetical protein